jgi:hypothetical protein
MIKDQEVERWIHQEFKQMLSVLVWRNEDGDYEAFGKYHIIPQNPGYRVYINDSDQGFFNSTRTAISWCVADKYNKFNLARDLLLFDNMLANISNDIFVRAGVANKIKDPAVKESIETKLEPKILHKRDLEQQLTKCVNRAKYLQQKGFENEASRSGPATTIKTNRQSV